MSDESIGMMDKAYFVGKVVIMQWLNDLLGVSNLLPSSTCAAADIQD